MTSSFHDVIPRFCGPDYELRWHERASEVIAERYTNEIRDTTEYTVDTSNLPLDIDCSFPSAEIVRELLRKKCIPQVSGDRVTWLPPGSAVRQRKLEKKPFRGVRALTL
mgnify:CR=1 FL=1